MAKANRASERTREVHFKITGALTSILSVFMEPQEDVVNFELLFCKLEQHGEPVDDMNTEIQSQPLSEGRDEQG